MIQVHKSGCNALWAPNTYDSYWTGIPAPFLTSEASVPLPEPRLEAAASDSSSTGESGPRSRGKLKCPFPGTPTWLKECLKDDKHIVVKIVWYWNRDSPADGRKSSSQAKSQMHRHFILDRGAKHENFQKGPITRQQINSDPSHTMYKSPCRMDKDLNIRPKSLSCLEENEGRGNQPFKTLNLKSCQLLTGIGQAKINGVLSN